VKKLYSLPECADILSCSVKTVRRLVSDGKISACRVRGGLRVVQTSLDSYISEIIQDFQFENGRAEFSGSDVDRDGQDILTGRT